MLLVFIRANVEACGSNELGDIRVGSAKIAPQVAPICDR
jgi:hypothetical protein